ncbi:hypothetical protein WJX74_001729 [Apatococcus lobatus]|uniref:Uncharacterized protein n=1 Tax=Apatococcus lobatus TaxID=904363 RepID=A0AAW1QM48_9CHLO
MIGRQRSSPTPSNTRRAAVARKLEVLPTPFSGFHRSNSSWGSLPSSGSGLSLADSPPARAQTYFSSRPNRPRRLRAWLIAFSILVIVTLIAASYRSSSVSQLQNLNQQAQSKDFGSAAKYFKPGAIWRDTDGVVIQAHAGCVIHHHGLYYMYGENKAGRTYQPKNPGGWSTSHVDMIGVSVYTSKDLLRWEPHGLALRPFQHPDLIAGNVLERPKVLYNANTSQFVMWMHIDTSDYEAARIGVAVADHPLGPFQYLRSFRPHGQQSRDLTIFKDDDGLAYVAYSSEDNLVMHISQLAPDFLSPQAAYVRRLINRRREAPSIFKHSGWYFMLTSGCTGWEPNRAEVFATRNIMGEWVSLGNPCTGATFLEHANTFFSQGYFVLGVAGQPGHFIFMADMWDPDNLGASRYVWLPMWVMDGRFQPRYSAEAVQTIRQVRPRPAAAHDERHSEMEQAARHGQTADQQQPMPGSLSNSKLPQREPKPQKAPVTRMTDFDFHLQHVASPPPEHSASETDGKVLSPAQSASTTAIKLDLADSQLHKSELIQTLSPPLKATTTSQGLSPDLPTAALGQRKLVPIDPLEDIPSSPLLDTRSAVVLRKLAHVSPSVDDYDAATSHQPMSFAGASFEQGRTSGSGSGQQAHQASVETFKDSGSQQSALSEGFEQHTQAQPSDKTVHKPGRKLVAASSQQEQAITLKVQQTVHRNSEAQTVAAAASERRHAGSVREQEIIKPIQKPHLPIDVIVHWYDAWQLDDLDHGPPEAALLDLV